MAVWSLNGWRGLDDVKSNEAKKLVQNGWAVKNFRKPLKTDNPARKGCVLILIPLLTISSSSLLDHLAGPLFPPSSFLLC